MRMKRDTACEDFKAMPGRHIVNTHQIPDALRITAVIVQFSRAKQKLDRDVGQP